MTCLRRDWACRPPLYKPSFNPHFLNIISRSLIFLSWKYPRVSVLLLKLHLPGVTAHGGPRHMGLLPSVVWRVNGSPGSPEGLGSLSRRPPLSLAPMEFAVNTSLFFFFFFYHELLTSHLMIIIFMKQPKQRSLALEELKTICILMMFSFSTSLDKKNRIPQCPDVPQTGETQRTNPITKE